jgi:hypothetical protein
MNAAECAGEFGGQGTLAGAEASSDSEHNA